MAKGDLIQKDDTGFVNQMRQFKFNIGKHAAVLGVTPEQIAAQAADADYYEFVVTGQRSIQTSSKAWTAAKKSIRYGGKLETDAAQTTTLVPPTLPDPVPPAVTFGVEGRFRALAQQIKRHPKYDLVIGTELGIEAMEQAAPDFTAIRPVIAARVNGDHVEIDWDWQGWRAFLDQCELQVDRGDGRGFVVLTFDTTPGFVDTTPFPEKPTGWAYRAMYREGDRQVGRWSNTVGILVPR